jgi:hypothetical protein
MGCGSTAPSVTPATGAGGFVAVGIVREVGPGPEPFEPIHRAQLVDVDGSVAAEWQVTQAAAPVTVQPGVYRLDVFTVFLGDTLVCVTDPAAPRGERCSQPTLGPGQVCSHDVIVVANRITPATFHVRPEGACALEVGDPAAT